MGIADRQGSAAASVGIQEEAPGLVLRETTERPEGVAAGTVRVVGTDAETIVHATRRLLDNSVVYGSMAWVGVILQFCEQKARSPRLGDGGRRLDWQSDLR